MPKHTTRKDLVLKARAGEFEGERLLEDAADCAFEYVPPEEDLRKMPTRLPPVQLPRAVLRRLPRLLPA